MNNQSGNPKGMMNNTDLIKRFLDMANCADASYAMLHWIDYKKKDDKNANNKTGQDDKNEDGDGKKIGYINPDNGLITTYARAIEARFDLTRFDNDITNIPKDTKPDQISQRTKDFTSRYEVVEHQENTKYGFSATLFKDNKDNKGNNQLILVCRGTEPTLKDIDTDVALAQGAIPLQCYELVEFYDKKVRQHLGKEEKLLVIGHSLGGYLAQSFVLMYPEKVKELYTFNSPGVLIDQSQTTVKAVVDGLTFAHLVRIGGQSLNSNPFFIVANNPPKELESHRPIIQKISSFRNNPKPLPFPVFHFETTNTLDTKKHSSSWLLDNATQHLGKDIEGKYLVLYVPEEGKESHYLDCTLRVLYFYSYLLALPSNQEKVQGKNLIESIEYLNKFASNVQKHYRIKHPTSVELIAELSPLLAFVSPDRYLPLLLSDIAKSLKLGKYSEIKNFQTNPGNLVDFIVELIKEKHFIKILDKENLKEFCDIHKINDPNNEAYKQAFADLRPYIFTDSDDNLTPIQIAYSYNSNTFYKMCNNQWGEEFIKSQYGAMKGLYFDGKAVSPLLLKALK